jgi:hypothetical protein
MFNSAYGIGVLPDHSPRAQASHRGLERLSELQLDSPSVSPMPLGTIRGYYSISIRQLLTAGTKPYLAIKVQGNILITRGVVAIADESHSSCISCLLAVC